MMDQNAHGRRPHYNRGRRGQDRRGNDRRTPPPAPAAQQDAGGREPREHVDVEQIMREIRARIAKGSGLDLANPQIHELAARRLEAILDPRSIKPALLEQLRRGAAAPDLPAAAAPPPIEVKDDSLSASFFQRLFRPLAALLAPILQAFRTQDAINKDAAEREAAANRRQAEWNALQFELLQKMVTETARVSIEMQAMALRIESLSTKVDFNERRVRTLESTTPPPRSAPPRQHEAMPAPPPREIPVYTPPSPPAAVIADAPSVNAATPPGTAGAPGDPADPARKRRRRRRGRRSGAGGPGTGAFAAVAGAELAAQTGDADPLGDDQDTDADEPGDDEPPMPVAADTVATTTAVTPLPMPQETTAEEPPAPAPEVVAAPLPEPEPPPAPAPAPAPAPPLESRVVWQQVTSAADPVPAPEQPMPPRDEAVPRAEPAPPPEPPEQGPAER